MKLVVVESPAKAKTIGKYLGPGYRVLASVGHIRDMPKNAAAVPAAYRGRPWATDGIDVDNEFAPLYVVPEKSRAAVAQLREALAGADELLLATDEDREGEAIAWHLLELLQPQVPVRRMVFHEITEQAINAALADLRDIDDDLVEAQETRRIVDRLYGYRVSPVLWHKAAGAKAAGRVQSAALRLVVQRERERIAFTSAAYSDVRATFDPGGFEAALVALDGQRIAAGKDFDDTGTLTGQALQLTQADAQQVAAALVGATCTVAEVQQKPGSRTTDAPFTTSTLQQAAGRRFGWSAKHTMDVAQDLYGGGHITYMRTDSTALSQQAVAAARSAAAGLYGADHVAPQVRTYPNRAKNAQEAHEAIRPSGETFRTPGQAADDLAGDALRLYELIWQRTVASQMADARTSTTTVIIDGDASGRTARLRASGTVTLFAGFRAVYVEAGDAQQDLQMPALAAGDAVAVVDVAAQEHRTAPRARYTEATLVAAMEELGIGRPSTYAKTLAKLVDHGYVFRKGSALVPTFEGIAAIQLLERHFASLVDYGFTAQVEDWLDGISRGEEARLATLQRFYFGSSSGSYEGLMPQVERAGDIDRAKATTIAIPGSTIVVRVGRHGAYLQRAEDQMKANLPDGLPPDELTAQAAQDLLEARNRRRVLGTHPVTGLQVSDVCSRWRGSFPNWGYRPPDTPPSHISGCNPRRREQTHHGRAADSPTTRSKHAGRTALHPVAGRNRRPTDDVCSHWRGLLPQLGRSPARHASQPHPGVQSPPSGANASRPRRRQPRHGEQTRGPDGFAPRGGAKPPPPTDDVCSRWRGLLPQLRRSPARHAPQPHPGVQTPPSGASAPRPGRRQHRHEEQTAARHGPRPQAAARRRGPLAQTVIETPEPRT